MTKNWTNSPLDNARPIWQPDQTTDNCTKCNMRFTFLNRRHHCRYCGRIFCGICTDYRLNFIIKKKFFFKNKII